MLLSFTIRNFRSIVNLTLDFTYGEGKAPNGHQQGELLPFIDTSAKERLVPCLAFFGANASGKTNILKAMTAFKQFVTQGDAPIVYFDPNLLNQAYHDTTFSLNFILNENKFEYTFVYDSGRILNELLKKNGRPLFEISDLKPKFSDQLSSQSQGYPKEKLADILRVECSDGNGRQRKLFLHRIGLGYQGLNKDMKDSFDYIKDSLMILPNDAPVSLPASVNLLAPLLNNNKKTALAEITDIVRRLDIDINDIDITWASVLPEAPPLTGEHRKKRWKIGSANMPGNEEAIIIDAFHENTEGQPVPLNFDLAESAGTQRLAGLVGVFLYALKTGAALFVDELENSLHPLLMRELVLLFKKRTRNEKGAQLIFTTHNTDILDDTILRLSEIALTRKNLANGTMIRRLVDFKNAGEDIRNITNFRKQYLDGLYSGIPHPAL